MLYMNSQKDIRGKPAWTGDFSWSSRTRTSNNFWNFGILLPAKGFGPINLPDSWFCLYLFQQFA